MPAISCAYALCAVVAAITASDVQASSVDGSRWPGETPAFPGVILSEPDYPQDTWPGPYPLNEDLNLVTADGELALGYGVDEGFNLVKGELGPIHVPLGTLHLTEATSLVRVKGHLDASAALGDGVVTSFVVYTSDGSRVPLTIEVILDQKTSAGTTWRFEVRPEDSTLPGPLVGQGVLSFESNGKLLGVVGNTVELPAEYGGVTPQIIELVFGDHYSAVYALPDCGTFTSLAAYHINGASDGVLFGYQTDTDGMVRGLFSNGMERIIGQVVIVPEPASMLMLMLLSMAAAARRRSRRARQVMPGH